MAQKIVHALPPRLVTRLTSVASRTLGQGSGLSGRTAPMYGLIGSLPSQDNVDDLVLDLLDQLTRPTLES